jgi:hypothetical protein
MSAGLGNRSPLALARSEEAKECIMNVDRRKVLAAVLVAAAAGTLAVARVDAGGDGAGAYKLEGAWIAKGVEYPLQWTYVMTPDSSGRRAALHGSIDVGVGGAAALGADYASPLIGELVMTGPNSLKFTAVWYGMKRLPAGAPVTAQIVYIGVNKGEASFVGPGEAVTSHHIAHYLPGADADGDGLPDAGTTPVVGPIPVTTTDTRVPAPQ